MQIGRKKSADAQGPTALEIGQTGTAEEFCRAAGSGKDLLNLQRGAFQAAEKGRFNNIAEMLLNPSLFTISFDGGAGHMYITRQDIFNKLIKMRDTRDEQADIIGLALAELPEQKKQEILQEILYDTLLNADYKRYGENFLAVLLEAGADVNAEFNGFRGEMLARAVSKIQPPSVMELLYNNGGKDKASFKDAFTFMKTHKWKDAEITALKYRQQEITGEPATIEIELERLREFGLTIEDVTTRKVDSPTKPLVPVCAQTVTRPKASLIFSY